MIEQKEIFEAVQTAFRTHHPKFPWPKKHGLEDQSDKFKRAFLAFSTDINAMHEEEINVFTKELGLAREIIATKVNECSREREKTRAEYRRAEKFQDRIEGKNGHIAIAYFVVFVLTVAIIALKINS